MSIEKQIENKPTKIVSKKDFKSDSGNRTNQAADQHVSSLYAELLGLDESDIQRLRAQVIECYRLLDTKRL